jgi:hypothetical protein
MGQHLLEKKVALHYRKGSTDNSCSTCDHVVRDLLVTTIGGNTEITQPRCRLMGLESGRRYRINLTCICDAHDSTAYMKRLIGGEEI